MGQDADERAAQVFAGALKAFENGGPGEVEERGNLARGMTCEIVQEQHFAGGLGQARDVIAHDGCDFAVGVVGMVGHRPLDVGFGTGDLAATGAAEVLRAVAGDHDEPCAELRLVTQRGEPLVGADEGLLHGVLGVGDVAQPAVGHGADRREVAFDERRETVGLALEHVADKLAVRCGRLT